MSTTDGNWGPLTPRAPSNSGAYYARGRAKAIQIRRRRGLEMRMIRANDKRLDMDKKEYIRRVRELGFRWCFPYTYNHLKAHMTVVVNRRWSLRKRLATLIAALDRALGDKR